MQLDLPIIISICALVLSILSPVLSAWISGHYRIEEKKLDLEAEKNKELHEIQVRHKMEVIEEYVRAVGELAKCDTTNREAAYGAVSGQIYLHVEQKYWPLLDEISKAIRYQDLNAIYNNLFELCKQLSIDNAIGADH